MCIRDRDNSNILSKALKMKKTLAALAVLGAFAGSAAAADVTLYGVVDLGLNYQYSKVCLLYTSRCV